MSAIAERLPGIMFVLEVRPGDRLHFSFVGERSQALWGIEPAALCHDVGALLGRMQSGDRDAFRSSLQAAQRAGQPWHWEGRVLADGAFRATQGLAQLRPGKGGSIAWYGIFVDVTTRRCEEHALEQALADLREALSREQLRSEALERPCACVGNEAAASHAAARQVDQGAALQRLASGLAHEINNPLTGIIYMFERLRHGGRRLQDRDDGAAIAAGLLRIQQSVSGLLQYAQPQAPRMEAVHWWDIAQAAAEMAQPALQHKRQRLVYRVEQLGDGAAHGDPRLLAQALVNVLLNASHAAPLGSSIAVDGERATARMGLHVCDCGPGIPKQYLHRVCEPFFTTKQQGHGSGLGLATSSRIMEAHAGELQIESHEGRGTRVSLWLPAPACGGPDGVQESSALARQLPLTTPAAGA